MTGLTALSFKQRFSVPISLATLGVLLLAACSDITSQTVPERVGTTKEHHLTTLAANLSNLSSSGAVDLANALAGPGVAVSNVTYTGDSQAAGAFNFTEQDDAIGFSQGIILSSGSITDVVGPNTLTDTTTVFGTPGDDDLDTLSGGSTTDAAVLEFSFVPDANKVFFQYVFGSEEYNEFVGTSFNDVFGFFVNGVNCAVIGDPLVPITVNTINNSSNSSLYIDNTSNMHYTEMDGFTKVLTCEASVNPGVTNTIKLALADVGDSSLDSWVFIKRGSLSTTPPGSTTPPSDPELANEGCTPGYWKNRGNRIDSWAATGYAQNSLVSSAFNTTSFGSLGSKTLLKALAFKGGSTTSGGAEILLRAATAALLNAAHPDVDYPLATSAVIAEVKAALQKQVGETDKQWRSRMLALATQLDKNNNLGCPLGG